MGGYKPVERAGELEKAIADGAVDPDEVIFEVQLMPLRQRRAVPSKAAKVAIETGEALAYFARLKPCPHCDGEGGFYTPLSGGDPVPLCELCDGLGLVKRSRAKLTLVEGGIQREARP